MDRVYAGGFPILQGFDGEFDLFLTWGAGIDVKDSFCWWRVGITLR